MKTPLRLAFLALAVALGATMALGHAYPARPVEFIIPFAPGGPTDTAIRLIQPALSSNLGVPVVLVNKAGGGGALGMDAVAKAKPDGYVLAATVRSTLTILPASQPDVPYKISDFTPIGTYAVDSQTVMVKTGAPWKTLEELVDHAKKNPGTLTYGSAGQGTNSFFTMELLKLAYGIDIGHVPFAGSGPVKNALLGGHVQVGAGEDAEAHRRPAGPGAREDDEGSGRRGRHRKGGAAGGAPRSGDDAQARRARERDRPDSGQEAGSRQVVRRRGLAAAAVLLLF